MHKSLSSLFQWAGNLNPIPTFPSVIYISSILLGLLIASPAWAVHRIGNIELDGNTANDGAAVSGIDDWDDVYKRTDHAMRSVFAIDSAPADSTTFHAGVKDSQSLNQWFCVKAGVQSKSNILHAYGATYSQQGDTFFYAGVDREGNLGDSNIGVWFFQGPVGCVSNGAVTPFFGTHLDGDLLMVAEFDNGGRVEDIQVYRWSDPDRIPQSGDECLGGAAGDCSDAGVPAFTGLNCNDSNPGDRVCGRTNPVNSINAAWRPGIKPQAFFELGANLTALIGDTGCFASAIVETRSSTSLTATLKDFVSLQLPTCGTLNVKKVTLGGNADFGFTIDPSAGGPDSFSLSGGTSQNYSAVNPGNYTISEHGMPAGPAAPDGWNLRNINCTGASTGTPVFRNGGHDGGEIDVAMDIRDDSVCTFTNEFTPPPGTITVQKMCESEAPAGQSFTYTLGGFAQSSNPTCAAGSVVLACGEAITCGNLTAGSYTVNETVPAGWALSSVNCIGGSGNCGNNLTPHASITLANADSAIAIFENTEMATIEICKETAPAATGGDFQFSGDLNDFSLADGECSQPARVVPDASYSITEGAQANFHLESIHCSGANWTANGSTAVITPLPGEAVSCTFFNVNNPAHIQVCKDTVTFSTDNPPFQFELVGPDPDLPVSTTLHNGECDFGPGNADEVALLAGGGYSVTEAPAEGWDTEIHCLGSGGAEDPANIVLSPDELVVCTFTNMQRGRIIVEKQANLDGSAELFNFTGDVAGSIADDGTIEVEVIAGQYTSTEALKPGWSLVGISCDDFDSTGNGATATFNVDAGEVVTCTFFNEFMPPTGSITILKACASESPAGQTFNYTLGGFAQSNNPICAAGAATLACGEAITCDNLVAGAYTINETVPDGWTLSEVDCIADNGICGNTLSPNASITLTGGDSAVTVFNNTEMATIEICKHTSPAGAGGEFQFSGDLGGFSLADDECTQAMAVIPNTSYSIDELAHAGFRLENISCSGANWTVSGTTATVTPMPGEAVSCTFFNAENPAYIQVCKSTLTVSTDSPQFQFGFNGPDPELPVSTALQNGSCDFGPGDVGALALAAGDGYSVTEAATEGWDTEISCVGASGAEDPANIALSPEERVVCTFTNTQRGRIIVEKQTTPQDSIETFDFTGDLTGSIGNNNSIELEVVAGQYSTTEMAKTDWNLVGIICDDTDSSGTGMTANFMVDPGEIVTCTFTNVLTPPPGTITVQKVCASDTPAGQSFGFTLAGFAQSDNPTCAAGSVAMGCGEAISCGNLAAGSYTVHETVPAGWTLGDVNCVGANTACDHNLTPHASITLAGVESEPDSAIAIFSNTEMATIEICKSVSPGGAGGDFQFTGDLNAFSLADGECTPLAEVTPKASYSVIESAKAGFQLESINCSGTHWTVDGSATTITPVPGEAVRCTFFNVEDPAYIQVCKVVVTRSSDSPPFQFELDGPDSNLPVTTSQHDGVCNFGQGDLNTVALAAGGGYSVTEEPVAGWDTEISCIGSSGAEDPANIELSPAEQVVCTFTNTQRGHIIVEKQTNPDGSTESFSFTGDVAGSIQDDGTIEVEVMAGQYYSTEAAKENWELAGISCDDDDSFGSGATANFRVDAGEIVTCTFMNSYSLAEFSVTKVFTDGNNPTEVRVTLECNTGLPLSQSFTITETEGVRFVVDKFSPGQMDCEIREDSDALEGYTGTYSASGPGASSLSDKCRFDDVEGGNQYSCTITNDADPVPVEIEKLWIFSGSEGNTTSTEYQLTLFCDAEIEGGLDSCDASDDLFGADKSSYQSCIMFSGDDSSTFFAQVTPEWPDSKCWVTERVFDTTIETENGCNMLTVSHGTGDSCLIINSVFFEGVPTLNRFGATIMILLLLGVSAVGWRRFA